MNSEHKIRTVQDWRHFQAIAAAERESQRQSYEEAAASDPPGHTRWSRIEPEPAMEQTSFGRNGCTDGWPNGTCAAQGRPQSLRQTAVTFAALAAALAEKLIANRLRDREDIIAILETQSRSERKLDWSYIKKWASYWEVSGRLDGLVSDSVP
jgi:hypothetical protein